jgi:hypothetical protein
MAMFSWPTIIASFFFSAAEAESSLLQPATASSAANPTAAANACPDLLRCGFFISFSFRLLWWNAGCLLLALCLLRALLLTLLRLRLLLCITLCLNLLRARAGQLERKVREKCELHLGDLKIPGCQRAIRNGLLQKNS